MHQELSSLSHDHSQQNDARSQVSENDPLFKTKFDFVKSLQASFDKVAWRIAQTILKKLPECVDSNPIKVALSLVKVIIDIKTAVEDNDETFNQGLQDTMDILRAVERSATDITHEYTSKGIDDFIQNLEKEIKALEALNKRMKPIIRILDYDAYKSAIQKILSNIRKATEIFKIEIELANNRLAGDVHAEIKEMVLKDLDPSLMADYKTLVDERKVKREACAEGTRVVILDDMTKWADNRNSPRIFWLTGPAGSGKTTITYTIAKIFENRVDDGSRHTILGANFLCSQQFEETSNRNRVIPTIAYQLASKCKLYALTLSRAKVSLNRAAKWRSISDQMRHLLTVPWKEYEATRPSSDQASYLIVVDALDEVSDGGGPELLHVLLTAVNDNQFHSLKFLLASRPNPKIVQLCRSFTSDSVCRLQDVPVTDAQQDITRYLQASLPKLQKQNPELLTDLGLRAGNLFVYASTAVRHLTQHDTITYTEQVSMLRHLLATQSYAVGSGDNSPLSIDGIYQLIMYNAFSGLSRNGLATGRLRIMFTFLSTSERISAETAALLNEIDTETVEAALDDLHAVLYKQDGRVFWYHASFPDFIFDKNRSNFSIAGEDFKFWCYEPAHQFSLATTCFKFLECGLKFNIANIHSSFILDSDDYITLSKNISANINSELIYSCKNWEYHLPPIQAASANEICIRISRFLQLRVLFWIEAMNLLELQDQCSLILDRAKVWVLKCNDGKYIDLARGIGEAAQFAQHFAESPAIHSTPHLYISALATWPHNCDLSQNWKRNFSHVPQTTVRPYIFSPSLRENRARSHSPMAPEEDVKGIKMNISLKIVSGSSDRSVWLWDGNTGGELLKLQGHTDDVNSVACSIDGTRLASGLHDTTVQVWDAHTGSKLLKLEGHTSAIRSVAVFNDCTRIVSGSGDHTVRVWDANTGEELHTLQGHKGGVNSVACSNDGISLVSGSDDLTVRVWDGQTGEELRVIEGHTHSVLSVAFTGNCKQIVSGSSDMTVRIWCAGTGEMLHTLKGHGGHVRSVACSPNSSLIASLASDGTVRVWCANSGAEVRVLKGHGILVQSVAFMGGLIQPTANYEDVVQVRGLPSNQKFTEDWVSSSWLKEPWTDNHLICIPKERSKNCTTGSHSCYSPAVPNIDRPLRGFYYAIDFSNAKIGKEWSQCYTPQAENQDNLSQFSDYPKL